MELIHVIRLSENIDQFTTDEIDLMEYIIQQKEAGEQDRKIPAAFLRKKDFHEESLICYDELNDPSLTPDEKDEANRKVELAKSIMQKISYYPVIFDVWREHIWVGEKEKEL